MIEKINNLEEDLNLKQEKEDLKNLEKNIKLNDFEEDIEFDKIEEKNIDKRKPHIKKVIEFISSNYSYLEISDTKLSQKDLKEIIYLLTIDAKNTDKLKDLFLGNC
jgi:hypothetical protein